MGSSIWQNDDHYKLKPLTNKLVKKAEQKLNITLPTSYINILKEQNGGYIKFNAYPTNVPTSWAEDHINVDHIFGIGKEDGILDSEYLIQEWGLPNNIVLLSGDGHSWIAFDYRNTKEEPPIIFIDVENEQIIELAPNFESFLNGLYIDEAVESDEDYSDIPRDWTIDELKIAFASNNDHEAGHALDYLMANSSQHTLFIEQSLIMLLQSSNLEMKQLAANYAHHFNEEGILSTKCVDEIVALLRKDSEIDYYADMFFSSKS